jgi:SAM-dependent methyltransferase
MSMWDQRYGGEAYAYGTEPNDFLKGEAARIPRGRVLCLAEGEGRNAVYLAGLGHDVTAVDLSREGLKKAERLAKARGVTLTLVHADLTTYEPAGPFTGVVSIFAHLPADARRALHARVAGALAPGGVFVLECYRPEQLAFGTGGPKDVALLPTLATLREELAGLDLVVARDAEREIHEGALHDGRSATVQIVAVKQPG